MTDKFSEGFRPVVIGISGLATSEVLTYANELLGLLVSLVTLVVMLLALRSKVKEWIKEERNEEEERK